VKLKRQNPYANLLERIRRFVRHIRYAHTVGMFYWSEGQMSPDRAWRLTEVYQRTLAAKSLGYEVVLEADDKGLAMKYRKVVEIPLEWQ